MENQRIGCLFVPELPLVACLRAEPELCEKAVAVVSGRSARAWVVACSEAAKLGGVTVDMQANCARSLMPELSLRDLSPALVRSALAALADVARSFSPRVAVQSNGEVFLDLSGVRRLFGSERKLATALWAKAARVGLSVRVGIGANRILSSLAAHASEGVNVVPPGEERTFLAPLPVSLLPASPDLQAALRRFGIVQLSQLGVLPSQGLGRRLGPEGLLLWRLAQGEDPSPLVPIQDPGRFVEESDTPYPVDQVEPLLFALQRLLLRLLDRLSLRGLSCRRLFLSLGLDPVGADERVLNAASPCRSVPTWLSLLKLSLEKSPPRAPVTSLRLEAEGEAAHSAQADLFLPDGPAPGALDEAIARLVVLSGEERVGSPRLVDSHRPGDFTLVPFGSRGGDRGQPVNPFPPLRAVRPPEEVKVLLAQDRPSYLRGRWLQGRVLQSAGPWRLERGWWEEEWRRDYYEVELTDGGIYRLFLSPMEQRWFVDGVCG